jgi:hypothetical protein
LEPAGFARGGGVPLLTADDDGLGSTTGSARSVVLAEAIGCAVGSAEGAAMGVASLALVPNATNPTAPAVSTKAVTTAATAAGGQPRLRAAGWSTWGGGVAPLPLAPMVAATANGAASVGMG